LPYPAGSSKSQQQQHSKTNGATHSHLNSSSSKQGANGTSSSSSIPRLPAGPPIRHSKLVQSRSSSSSSGGRGTKQPLHSKQPQQQQLGPLGSNAAVDNADDTQGWEDAGVSYDALIQQQMQQQDEALDHISIHVDRIKQTGLMMHEELEEQVRTWLPFSGQITIIPDCAGLLLAL
jgi:hypothetical protein